MMRRFLMVLLLVPLLASCDDDPAIAPKTEAPPAPNAPKLAIVDGSNGGIDVFRWQPPMVPTADPQGSFDDGAQPIVEICVQGASECVVFATTGINLPAPTVSAGGKKGSPTTAPQYTVPWNTKLFTLDPNKAYTVTVRRGTTLLGSADVDVVSSSAGLASVPAGYVGVVVGTTLDINFRVIKGITRTWLGTAGSTGGKGGKNGSTPPSPTDWSAAANWSPAGVPFRLDTVVVPATSNQPALTANAGVGGLVVNTGATVALSTFNLTTSASVSTSGTGKITGNTGLLILGGTGTFGGTLPNVQVTGSYAAAAGGATVADLRLDNLASPLDLTVADVTVNGDVSSTGAGTSQPNGFVVLAGASKHILSNLQHVNIKVMGTYSTDANREVGGVAVVDGTLAIGPYDLTTTGDVATPTPLHWAGTGSIACTTGRIILAGTFKNLVGDFPCQLRIFGSYTLVGNVNVDGSRMVIQGGRLRNTSFRLRERPL